MITTIIAAYASFVLGQPIEWYSWILAPMFDLICLGTITNISIKRRDV